MKKKIKKKAATKKTDKALIVFERGKGGFNATVKLGGDKDLNKHAANALTLFRNFGWMYGTTELKHDK